MPNAIGFYSNSSVTEVNSLSNGTTGPVLAVTLPENPGTGYSVVLEIRKADATIDRLTVNGDSGTAVSPLNMGEYQVDLGNGYSLTSVGNVTFIPYGTRAANGQLRVMKKAARLAEVVTLMEDTQPVEETFTPTLEVTTTDQKITVQIPDFPAGQSAEVSVPCPAEWTGAQVTVNGVRRYGVHIEEDQVFFPMSSNDAYEITPIQVYSISISQTANGTVTSSTASAPAGETVQLTVVPASGYQLASLAVTDASGQPVAVNGFSFVMPAAAAERAQVAQIVLRYDSLAS